MMSPIARRTEVATRRRESAGELERKGSGRAVNACGREPSVAELLASASDIETLAELRRRIFATYRAGLVTATTKTLRSWEERLWVRVVELMRREPRRASYILNTVKAWPKPDGFGRALELEVVRLMRPLPSDAELLAQQGIKTEGIT